MMTIIKKIRGEHKKTVRNQEDYLDEICLKNGKGGAVSTMNDYGSSVPNGSITSGTMG